ncbi:hypothetical protein [Sinomicrobium soli]|uniref:hypothetical protein n=1 Tax=Sinomicrobium sp. N-1-3-6 TaxID=2219864 RepID=UPI000DCF5924|nr:hypothetical protein [Sinomicrobium sp. N-1-3-6]RAV29702.1 hypothetical protein DN748_06185 [Sinomicrobium sp. N-1-3-6]
MAIQTNIKISINGEAITKFSRMGIQQGLLSHHTFFVRQPLPKAFIAGVIDKAQQYVGQQIQIEIAPKNIKDTNTGLIFKGLVTHVDIERSPNDMSFHSRSRLFGLVSYSTSLT